MREFKIEDVSGKKTAIFEDGHKCPIFENSKDGEYFYPPNWLLSESPECEKILNKWPNFQKETPFFGRIKDAVMSILNDDGDVISVDKYNNMNVVYFLDRKMGENIRKQFVNDSNYEFAYDIMCTDTRSPIHSTRLVCDHGEYYGILNDKGYPIKYFETYAKAEEYMNDLIWKTYDFIKTLDRGIFNTYEYHDELHTAMREFTGSRYGYNVMTSIAFDMIDYDGKLKYDEPKLDNLQIIIMQDIVK